jgi:hypothetical protein
MAVIRPLDPTIAAPIWPESIAPAQILLSYNPLADELVILFGDATRPHIVEPLDGDAPDYVSLLLDLESDAEVVGIMVESAHGTAIAEHPEWRAFVNAAPSHAGRRRPDPEVWPALAAFMAEVRSMAEHGA